MRRPRSGFDLFWDSGWKKRRKLRSGFGWETIPHLLMVLAAIAVRTAAWEDGEDGVNVISVENLDAILGLRMVTELRSFEGVKTNESENRFQQDENVNETTEQASEPRYKRMVNPKWRTFFSSQVSDLCSTARCFCTTNTKNEHINISCDFQNEKVILQPGSIPSTAEEVHIWNVKHLNITPGTFSNHRQLEKVHIHHIGTLLVSDTAFQNLSVKSFNLTVEGCNNLTLEAHAFRNLRNPLTATMLNCFHVVLKKGTFSWFSQIVIQNVPDLKLEENTFSSEMVKQDVEWPGPLMLFMNVTFHKIPNATFPLSSAKIVFLNCTINVIRSGAFNGIALDSVSFQSTRIKRIEGGAFSERTLVQDLEFHDADIQHVESNALSAAARLTIQNCRVEEMTSGAFNVSTAYLRVMNNYFLKIRRHAFEIHNWNSIDIEENHFNDLEPEFFSAPFSNITDVTTEFTFSNNTLARVEMDVLSFIPNDFGLNSLVTDNIFEYVCHCHLKTWIRERAGNSWQSFYETSYCVISDLLEKCYNISRNYMNMEKYAEEFCTEDDLNVCDQVRKTIRPNILIPLDLYNTEKTVLGVIFMGILASIAIMITILVLLWAKSKSFCGGKRKSQIPNNRKSSCCFRFCPDGNLVTTDSISRMNIHEYAEIQNQLNHRQKQTNLTIEEDLDDEDEMIECENKATQTIPEELTQELIQSLREKLDNPENYNEARDMIEHLYDLIKVEESCNNNNPSRTNSFILDEEEEIGGIYEVIQSNKSLTIKNGRSRRKNVAVTTTGTRVPSPDKLSPITFNIGRQLPTVVCDYVEPKDRKSNEYCELPSANQHVIMPDVLASSQIKGGTASSKSHIYAEPLQGVGTSMSKRPLPSKPAEPGPSVS